LQAVIIGKMQKYMNNRPVYLEKTLTLCNEI
jgi:hypothetical protein